MHVHRVHCSHMRRLRFKPAQQENMADAVKPYPPPLVELHDSTICQVRRYRQASAWSCRLKGEIPRQIRVVPGLLPLARLPSCTSYSPSAPQVKATKPLTSWATSMSQIPLFHSIGGASFSNRWPGGAGQVGGRERLSKDSRMRWLPARWQPRVLSRWICVVSPGF